MICRQNDGVRLHLVHKWGAFVLPCPARGCAPLPRHERTRGILAVCVWLGQSQRLRAVSGWLGQSLQLTNLAPHLTYTFVSSVCRDSRTTYLSKYRSIRFGTSLVALHKKKVSAVPDLRVCKRPDGAAEFSRGEAKQQGWGTLIILRHFRVHTLQGTHVFCSDAD